MQAAGIRRLGAQVEMIEVGEPRPLAGDEVLLEVRAAGVANWDEFVRTGGWDVGARSSEGQPKITSTDPGTGPGSGPIKDSQIVCPRFVRGIGPWSPAAGGVARQAL